MQKRGPHGEHGICEGWESLLFSLLVTCLHPLPATDPVFLPLILSCLEFHNRKCNSSLLLVFWCFAVITTVTVIYLCALTTGLSSQAMIFPVVMYRCERWTIKKAEHWRIDAFELWCWKRLLRVPWTARRSNQSILKEINPEYSSEGLILMLKFQFFGHLMQRANSLEKTLMLGRNEGRKRRG